MKVAIDINIFGDVTLDDRDDFIDSSEKVINWCAEFADETIVAWHTIPTLYYLLQKHKTDKIAREYLTELLNWVKVSPTSQEQAKIALTHPIKDYEDALQIICSQEAGAEVFITRNIKHFKKSPLRVLTPDEFLQEFEK